MYAGYGYEMNLLSDEPGCYPDAYMEWVEKNASQHIDALRVPEPRGARGHFDEWVLQAPEEYSHSAWIAHEACNFLRAYSDPRPFFLSLGFYAPHPPLNPPNQYVELYNPADLPLPVQHPSEMERNRYRDVTLEEWQRAKMFFYAMCSVVDHYVAQIMDTLKATGFGDDTLVVFMSDHGDALGDHGQLGKGPSNYESIVRVPCLLWHPSRIPAGRRVPALIESIDIFPALGDYCALKMPAGVKGVNIKPLIQGETEEGRDDILIEFKDPRRGFSVKTLRSTEYKYFRYHDGREVLYDLGENDEEVFDKSKDQAYQGTIQEMRGRLLNRLINAEDDLPERTHDY
jgi:arylsulfatase A-like enzyme